MTSALTAREQQVCDKLCLGWTNKEIASLLGLSPRTIEDHRTNIFDKLKVRNTVELVRYVHHIGEKTEGGIYVET
jgi:DNA-binding NarL/FixJ family response regulator